MGNGYERALRSRDLLLSFKDHGGVRKIDHPKRRKFSIISFLKNKGKKHGSRAWASTVASRSAVKRKRGKGACTKGVLKGGRLQDP